MELFDEFLKVIEIGVLIGTAVWAVSKIKATTEVLSTSLEHLSGSVGRLDTRVESLGSSMNRMGNRMTRMETKLELVEPMISQRKEGT